MSTTIDIEKIGWFSGQWKPPPLQSCAASFLGPFILFLVLQGLTKATNLQWDNGSFGAAAVIMFSIPSTSASIPRHVILGQIISALTAYGFGYALPYDSVSYVRVALAVAVSTLLMKLVGISYPPGGATAYILSHEPVLQWSAKTMMFYLLFPLLVGSVILIVCGLVIDNVVLKEKYPQLWI